MSSNKGKDGEMRVMKILADIAISENDFEPIRATITNESDMGADFEITSTSQSLQRMLQIGGVQLSDKDEMNLESSKKVMKSRMDVKTTQSKIGKDTVDKFATDVHKHPNTTTHILIGGTNLTAPAQREFNQYKEVFAQEGKVLAYISNEGKCKLASHYANALPEESEND